jgi:cyclophilin family peptidyl-prolyl cis-trans isomerase
VTDPQFDAPRGVSPFVWVIIALVLVIGIGGAIVAVAFARDETDVVQATSDTAPGETLPIDTLPPETAPVVTVPISPPDYQLDPALAYTATFTTSLGDIVIALDTEAAPVGAGHFVKLAKEGFYDGLTFHRASANFVIQGGDPNGDGTGGSGTSVVAEVPADNYPLGALAAAKTGTDPPGTFDAQFFIVTGTNGMTLPNEYARFGTVTSGLDIAQQIEHLAPPEGDGPPSQPVTIETVTISESPA